jgi:hypothetical protein
VEELQPFWDRNTGGFCDPAVIAVVYRSFFEISPVFCRATLPVSERGIQFETETAANRRQSLIKAFWASLRSGHAKHTRIFI